MVTTNIRSSCLVCVCHFQSMDDGSLRMYYTGQRTDGSTAVGVAKLALGATTWAREQAVFSLV